MTSDEQRAQARTLWLTSRPAIQEKEDLIEKIVSLRCWEDRADIGPRSAQSYMIGVLFQFDLGRSKEAFVTLLTKGYAGNAIDGGYYWNARKAIEMYGDRLWDLQMGGFEDSDRTAREEVKREILTKVFDQELKKIAKSLDNH